MNPMQKIKDSPHYLHLKESVENRYARKRFFSVLVFCSSIVLLVLLILQTHRDHPDKINPNSIYSLAFMCLVCSVFILYEAYRWLGIFRHIESYTFCQAQLMHPHEGSRFGVKFTVQFKNRHGEWLRRDTRFMFSSRRKPYLEEYNNHTVLIGYNEETDRVVVIKRVDSSGGAA